jgi:broad specificity phosphatase PhoE
LIERGGQDARELGQRLRATTFARVFSSPRQRARQTCALVASVPAAEIEPDLAEWDYGEYEGKHSVEFAERDRIGTCSVADVLVVKCPPKFRAAPIG